MPLIPFTSTNFGQVISPQLETLGNTGEGHRRRRVGLEEIIPIINVIGPTELGDTHDSDELDT